MLSRTTDILSTWGLLDTWTVVVAALAAMACALPGNFLLLRRHSMMGDAISHTVLLGIVLAFLFSHWLKSTGWLSDVTYETTKHSVMFAGAMLTGLLSALLAEGIRKLGKVEASAALGVVFTTLFAAGLLLLRLFADDVHIDPACVLYGTLEDAAFTTGDVPPAAWANGATLLVCGLLAVVFFKELRISAFDPAMATTLGINATVMHYGLMAVTAGTVVAAFESVGSILVIAMLIVPPATAHLLTDRLRTMVLLSLAIAALTALAGHLLAILVPPVLLVPLGFDELRSESASTAGMMAVTAGLLFVLAALCGPRYGILSRIWHRAALSLKIAREDVLGLLFRLEEADAADNRPGRAHRVEFPPAVRRLTARFAIAQLRWQRNISAEDDGYRLTATGRHAAQQLVRAHRLWESYMGQHFTLPEDHLHETAARVEHFIGPELQQELAAELKQPSRDPHGREIPRTPHRTV